MIVVRGRMSGESARAQARAINSGHDVHILWVVFETLALAECGEDGRWRTVYHRTGNRIFHFRTALR